MLWYKSIPVACENPLSVMNVTNTSSVPYCQNYFVTSCESYDSIQRDTLWECMKEFKIPTKFINMCKTCVQKTRSAVPSFFFF